MKRNEWIDEEESGTRRIDLEPLLLLAHDWERRSDELRGRDEGEAQAHAYDVCAAQLRAAIESVSTPGMESIDTETGELFG